MSLGERIRELRQSRGITQAELGGTELSKGFISLLETGRTRPSVETLSFLAARLGTTIDDLLGHESHDPKVAAGSLLSLARDAIRKREFSQATKLVESVIFLADSYKVSESKLEAQLLSALIALEERRFSEAWDTLEHARDTAISQEDPWRTGRALQLMGRIKMLRREFGEAASLFESALATLRRAKASRDPARIETLILLGSALTYLGDPQAGLKHYTEAAESEVARRAPVLRGRALWGLGAAYRKLGNYDAAKSNLMNAKDAFESVEELRDLIRVLHNIGQLLHERGDDEGALKHLLHGLRVMDRLGMPVDSALIMTEVARVHLSLSNLDEAEHFAQHAFAEARRVGDLMELSEAQAVLGRIQNRRGNTEEAKQLLQEALSRFNSLDMKAKVAELARELGSLLQEQGDHPEAAENQALAVDKPQELPSVIEFRDPVSS